MSEFIWLPSDALPLFETMAWREVYRYDRQAKKFTSEHLRDPETGALIWQGKALMRVGWDGDPGLVDVRTASMERPASGSALMETLTGKSKDGGTAAVASMWEPGGESR